MYTLKTLVASVRFNAIATIAIMTSCILGIQEQQLPAQQINAFRAKRSLLARD